MYLLTSMFVNQLWNNLILCMLSYVISLLFLSCYTVSIFVNCLGSLDNETEYWKYVKKNYDTACLFILHIPWKLLVFSKIWRVYLVCVCVCACACTHTLNCFSCVRFCNPLDCSLPGSSVHRIFLARLGHSDLNVALLNFTLGFPEGHLEEKCIHLLEQMKLRYKKTQMTVNDA